MKIKQTKREKYFLIRQEFEKWIIRKYNSTPLEQSEGGRWSFILKGNYFEV